MAFGHMHWNRKELSLKERRLERSERFEPYARWRRDSVSGGLHGFVHEGLHGDIWDFSGYGKGGLNQRMEEPAHGYVPCWSSNGMLRYESCQQQVPFIDAKIYRDGGQTAKQRDPRGGGSAEERINFSNMTRRLLDRACNRRSVGESLLYPWMSPVGYMNKSSSYYLQRKNMFGKGAGAGGLSTGQSSMKALVLKDCSNKPGRENACTSPVDSVNRSCCYSSKNKSLSCQSHLMDQPHRTAGASGLSTDHKYDKISVSTDCSEREIGEVFSSDQSSLVDSANNFLCCQSHHLGEMAGAGGVSIEQECDKALSSPDCREKSNSITSSYACRTVVDHEKKSSSHQRCLKKLLGELSSAGELVSGQDCESSLGSTDWKPFKRTRCGFSSGGLRSVHPGTSGSTRDSDSSERKDPSLRGVKLPAQDTAELVVSDVPSEELPPRKKQRLGWGEGLAKYEKKKAEGPSGSTYNSSADPIQPARSVADKRLVPATFSDYSSSATHFTTKDMEENCWRTLSARKGFSSLVCDLICYGSQSQLEDFSLMKEKWDLTSFLQFDIPRSIASGSEGYAAIDRLLGCKANILKELETTVSKIDSLEIELKSFVAGDGNSCIKEAKEISKDIEEIDADNPFAAAFNLFSPSSAKDIQGESLRITESRDQTTEVGQISAAGGHSGEKINISSFHVDGIGAECDGDGIYKVSSGYSCTESVLHLSILSFNKEAAKCASKELNGLLLKDHWKVENLLFGTFSCRQNDLSITEKLVKQKKFKKFKERVLSFKYKILHFLWKEELLLSSKDSKRKCPVKFKSSIRIRHKEYQKWRSFLRSRFPSLVEEENISLILELKHTPYGGHLFLHILPHLQLTWQPGNSSIAQLQGIIDYARNLTQDSDMKICRKTLQMPTLILDKKEKTTSMFISSNGFVEDPCEDERERAMVNLWTLEEREIFLNRFAIFGKDFKKIASFLVHKTAGDCVQFYYKNHKSDWFQSAMEKLDFTTQAKWFSSCNNQVIPLKKRKPHRKAVSSELISMVPYDEDADGKKSDCKASAGHCGGCQALKLRKCGSGKKMPLMPDDQGEEEGNFWGEASPKRDHFIWTDEEKALFIEALSTYGKDFAMISDCVGTKSSEECIIFFSKARSCLRLDQIDAGARDVQSCINNDANGGSDSVITSAVEVSEMNQNSVMQLTSNKLDSLRVNSPTDLNNSDERSVVEHLFESICSKRSATSITNAQTGTACFSEVPVSKAESMESFSMFSSEAKNRGLTEGSQNKLAHRNGIPFAHLSCWQEKPYGIEAVDQSGVRFAAKDFSIESSGSSAADTSVCSLRKFNPETSLGAPNITRDFERTSCVTFQQGIHPVTVECGNIQHVKAEDEYKPSLRRDQSLEHMPGHGLVSHIQSSEIPRVYASQKPSDAQELAGLGGMTDMSTLQSWPLNRCSTSSGMAGCQSIPKTFQEGLVCGNKPASIKLFGCMLTLPPQPSQRKFDLNTCGFDLAKAQHPNSCNSSSQLEFYQSNTGIKHDEDYHLDLQLGSLPRCAMLPVKNDGVLTWK